MKLISVFFSLFFFCLSSAQAIICSDVLDPISYLSLSKGDFVFFEIYHAGAQPRVVAGKITSINSKKVQLKLSEQNFEFNRHEILGVKVVKPGSVMSNGEIASIISEIDEKFIYIQTVTDVEADIAVPLDSLKTEKNNVSLFLPGERYIFYSSSDVSSFDAKAGTFRRVEGQKVIFDEFTIDLADKNNAIRKPTLLEKPQLFSDVVKSMNQPDERMVVDFDLEKFVSNAEIQMAALHGSEVSFKISGGVLSEFYQLNEENQIQGTVYFNPEKKLFTLLNQNGEVIAPWISPGHIAWSSFKISKLNPQVFFNQLVGQRVALVNKDRKSINFGIIINAGENSVSFHEIGVDFYVEGSANYEDIDFEASRLGFTGTRRAFEPLDSPGAELKIMDGKDYVSFLFFFAKIYLKNNIQRALVRRFNESGPTQELNKDMVLQILFSYIEDFENNVRGESGSREIDEFKRFLETLNKASLDEAIFESVSNPQHYVTKIRESVSQFLAARINEGQLTGVGETQISQDMVEAVLQDFELFVLQNFYHRDRMQMYNARPK